MTLGLSPGRWVLLGVAVVAILVAVQVWFLTHTRGEACLRWQNAYFETFGPGSPTDSKATAQRALGVLQSLRPSGCRTP
jgi:uncharacterized membrane protein YqiK